MNTKELDQLCVNTIRTLSMDGVQKANSGHPGMPMGMADVAYVLWTQYLKHNPKNSKWLDRDRFVLSAGHGSMLLYSLLHLSGYDVSLDDIKNFRQWGSITPGHPEVGHTDGVETTTGPLGQGFANGVGMAMAEEFLAAHFNESDNKVVDHYTYAIVSDGDLMEGVTQEAASLAGHLKLGKLIYLYDDNDITIDGSTDLAFTEDVLKRFDAYGWHVTRIDGHNHDEIKKAIEEAHKVTDKPSLISCKTKIGFGSPNKEGSSSSHGSPLGEEEIVLTKKKLGWEYEEKFFIPEEALNQFRKSVEKGAELEKQWHQKCDTYNAANPEKAAEFNKWFADLDVNWDTVLPKFKADPSGMATRKASGEVLKAVTAAIPNMLGGSADLSPSNNTHAGQEAFNAENYGGKYVHYGIREHAMGSIMNGIKLHGGVIPYGGTFLIFSDYCRPAIRLAALSKVPNIFVFTHDSIGLGEDGPTHQPIEQVPSLRTLPNHYTLRPADANETAYCWKIALESKETPSSLALTRQNLPTYERTEANSAALTEKGAYILFDSDKQVPDAILMASGSEVEIIVQAKEQLKAKGIDARVVSMPCWELFRKQPDAYKQTVFPPEVTARIAVEAASPFGWSEWTGDKGRVIALDHFGASAPYQTIYKEFGLTPENVVSQALELLQ